MHAGFAGVCVAAESPVAGESSGATTTTLSAGKWACSARPTRVILGLMLYAVWTSYQEADIHAETEANWLVSVFRVADGLPAARRDQVHRLAREYVNILIEQEWPTMEKRGWAYPGTRL